MSSLVLTLSARRCLRSADEAVAQRGANRPARIFAEVGLSVLLYVSFEPNAVVKSAEIIRNIGDSNCLANAREITGEKLFFIELIQESCK